MSDEINGETGAAAYQLSEEEREIVAAAMAHFKKMETAEPASAELQTRINSEMGLDAGDAAAEGAQAREQPGEGRMER